MAYYVSVLCQDFTVMDDIISCNCLIVVIVLQILSGYSCTVMFHIELLLMRIVESMSTVDNRQ